MPVASSSPAFPNLDKLRFKPLELSGALNDQTFPRHQLTPAIGLRFEKEVKLKEILQAPKAERDDLLRDLVILSAFLIQLLRLTARPSADSPADRLF